MSKTIKIEFTERQFVALIELIDSSSAVFEEIPEEQNNIKLIDRALNKSGYKRKYK